MVRPPITGHDRGSVGVYMAAPPVSSALVGGRLQLVHAGEKQMRRQIGWPWFPRAPSAAASAASLAAPPAQAVAALPCPPPHHRTVVRAFSANGARGVRRMRPQVGPAILPLGKCPVEASGSGNTAAEAEAPSLAPCSGQRRAAWGQAGSLRGNKHLERCEIGNHESSYGDPGAVDFRRRIPVSCGRQSSCCSQTPGLGPRALPSPTLPWARTVLSAPDSAPQSSRWRPGR